MKISDDYFDVDNNVLLASIFGVFCALASAMATVNYMGAAYIFIAIIIGNLLALKIDGIHHVITMLVFIIICLISGIPNLSLVVLLICVLCALGDEIGHENISKVTDNAFLNLFFEYRFLMKVILLLLVLFNVFEWPVFVLFILFEVSYLLGGFVFERLKKEV